MWSRARLTLPGWDSVVSTRLIGPLQSTNVRHRKRPLNDMVAESRSFTDEHQTSRLHSPVLIAGTLDSNGLLSLINGFISRQGQSYDLQQFLSEDGLGTNFVAMSSRLTD